MTKIMQDVKQFLNDEEGATALEYGVMAALIVGVIVTVVKGIGTDLNTAFTTLRGHLAA
jgi:pilus assembly protein Flp/PilA